jgi:AraC-like DNA-binding protein
MDIENLPTLQARDFGNAADPGRPLLSFEWSAQGPHRVPGHTHPRAQAIFQTGGVYRVVTPKGSWVVPKHQAIWIPSGIFHETFTNDSASALMLFVDRAFTACLPQDCMTFAVSPLLGELFYRIVENGNDYPAIGSKARLVEVMLDEIAAITPAPLHLPLAKDKRLRRAMDLMLENPAHESDMDALAVQCGASSRTLARLFVKHTGMTFTEWRKRQCLLEAIDRLGNGEKVTTVALELGYRSPSAFIAMFRRNLGVSPGHYVQKQ